MKERRSMEGGEGEEGGGGSGRRVWRQEEVGVEGREKEK